MSAFLRTLELHISGREEKAAQILKPVSHARRKAIVWRGETRRGAKRGRRRGAKGEMERQNGLATDMFLVRRRYGPIVHELTRGGWWWGLSRTTRGSARRYLDAALCANSLRIRLRSKSEQQWTRNSRKISLRARRLELCATEMRTKMARQKLTWWVQPMSVCNSRARNWPVHY